MSTTLMKTVINCETGVVENLPLTPAEVAELEATREMFSARDAEREAAATAAAEAKASAEAKLTALGLTAEEIAALTK